MLPVPRIDAGSARSVDALCRQFEVRTEVPRAVGKGFCHQIRGEIPQVPHRTYRPTEVAGVGIPRGLKIAEQRCVSIIERSRLDRVALRRHRSDPVDRREQDFRSLEAVLVADLRQFPPVVDLGELVVVGEIILGGWVVGVPDR